MTKHGCMSLTLSECIRVNTDTAIVDKDEGFGHTPTPQDKVTVHHSPSWNTPNNDGTYSTVKCGDLSFPKATTMDSMVRSSQVYGVKNQSRKSGPIRKDCDMSSIFVPSGFRVRSTHSHGHARAKSRLGHGSRCVSIMRRARTCKRTCVHFFCADSLRHCVFSTGMDQLSLGYILPSCSGTVAVNQP
jgi:hypothetical protein